MNGRWVIGTLAALSAGAGLLALAMGRLDFPLDDAYIYLHYARAAADGDWFRYAAGEPATAGATGLLWVLLVTALTAAASALGGGHAAVVGTVLALHAAIAFATLATIHRLLRRWGAPAYASLAPAALAAFTPLWFFGWFNGMETGLYGWLLLLGAWVLSGGSPAWLFFLALARPEGALLAAAILAVRLAGRGASRESGTPRAAVLVAGLGVALGFAWPWLATGAGSTAWAAKALWTEPDPETRLFYGDRALYFGWRALWFGLSGARPQPPLDLAHDLFTASAWPTWIRFAFLGGGLVLAAIRWNGALLGTAIFWIAATLLARTAIAWDAQHYRYLMAAWPLLLALATAGWFGAALPNPASPATRPRAAPVPFAFPARVRGGLGLLLLGAACAGAFLGTVPYRTALVQLYRGECERMRLGQIATGRWIAENLPPDARVAAHDVGALAVFGARPLVDLVGLVTPETAGAYRHGEGALWEAVSRLPVERRPTHAAIVPAWMPYLTQTSWFDQRLHPAGPARRDPTRRAFEVWRLAWPDRDRATWPGGDFGDVPALPGFAGLVLDAVDVADLASEAAHAFRADDMATPAPGEKPTIVRDFGFAPEVGAPTRAHAMEGGRRIHGAAEFTLAVPPGRDALLVLRATAPRAVTLAVKAWEWESSLTVRGGEDAYRETAVLVPAHALEAAPRDASGNARPTLRVEGGPYAAFHWWLVALPE